MRQWLAILFFIIFSLQVLPVKAIGKLMVKAQTEEDAKHNDADDDSDDVPAINYSDIINHHPVFILSAPVYNAQEAIFTEYYKDGILPSYIAEIPSPPPNL